MKKRYWLGIAVSAFFVVLLVRSVELASVASAFSQADLRFLLPAVLLYFAGVFPRAVRWAILLRPVQRLSVGRLYQVLVMGFMANDILPLRAGEAVRAFILWRKERVEPGATVATILVERIFDGVVLTGFLALGALVVPLDDSLSWLARVAAVIFLVAIGALFGLALAPRLTLSLAEFALRPFPERFSSLSLRVIRSFEDGLKTLRSGRDLLLVLALSTLAWVLEAGMYYLLMYSFAFEPRYMAAVLGTAVANLASMVPSSPGYVGTFDWGLLKVLSDTFGVDASQAAAYTGLVHAALILPVVLLGLLLLWREGLSLRRIASRKDFAVPRASEEPVEKSEATAPRSLP